MRHQLTAFVLAVLTVLATLPARVAEPEPIGNMVDLQRFSHKLHLAIRQNNLPLADFYADKLEEPIGGLTTTMLAATFERLEAGMENPPTRRR